MSFKIEDIEKYILYCKLCAEIRTKKYDVLHSKETTKHLYNAEYGKCLEKYYTRCLKDVYDYNYYTNYIDRKDISICERVIDAYYETLRHTDRIGELNKIDKKL